MTYYAYLSYGIYHQMRVTKPDEIKDLPEIKKIIWVPIASAFACSVFKTWLINISTPIFLLIAKD